MSGCRGKHQTRNQSPLEGRIVRLRGRYDPGRWPMVTGACRLLTGKYRGCRRLSVASDHGIDPPGKQSARSGQPRKTTYCRRFRPRSARAPRRWQPARRNGSDRRAARRPGPSRHAIVPASGTDRALRESGPGPPPARATLPHAPEDQGLPGRPDGVVPAPPRKKRKKSAEGSRTSTSLRFLNDAR